MVALQSTLIWLFENRAAKTVVSIYWSFLHFIRSVCPQGAKPISDISDIDLINYRGQLSDRQINRLRTLSVLLKVWRELGLPGVSADAVRLLKAMRLNSTPVGEAVRIMCPTTGPLSQLEDESFQCGLNEAYARGVLRDDEFFAIWITRALGQRPSQCAALKVCDLVVTQHDDHSTEYTIKIPRAKQRGRLHLRESFKVRPLIEQIGRPLLAYVRQVAERFIDSSIEPEQAPMFPRKEPMGSVGYEYHRTGDEMSMLITDAIAKIGAVSERTGKRLHVFPTRLRRTVGTRAAQEGHGELVIAEILDHSNISSAGYYVEAVPEIALRIDAAMAKTMAPIANAFKGTPPNQVGPGMLANMPQIIDLRIDQAGKSMGGCNSNGSCAFNAPIACYTCRSFKPWLDGPHQAVLDFLLARREQQLSSTNARIASVNDRTILAVAEVIAMCTKRLPGA
jgi:hypothetical protein